MLGMWRYHVTVRARESTGGKCLPKAPDLNPIEKVWGSMKNVLRDVHFRKPENRNLAGLKNGFKQFWK